MTGTAVPLIVLIRWLHALAATVWVGGMFFYVAVLNPLLRRPDTGSSWQPLVRAIAKRFQDVTQGAIAAVLLTGGVLTFDRLAQPHVLRPYVLLLAVKVALAILMIALAGGLGRRRRLQRWPRWLSTPYLILALGVLVYLLAVALQVTFDLSYGAVS